MRHNGQKVCPYRSFQGKLYSLQRQFTFGRPHNWGTAVEQTVQTYHNIRVGIGSAVVPVWVVWKGSLRRLNKENAHCNGMTRRKQNILAKLAATDKAGNSPCDATTWPERCKTKPQLVNLFLMKNTPCSSQYWLKNDKPNCSFANYRACAPCDWSWGTHASHNQAKGFIQK